MKRYLLPLFAAAALASCSQNGNEPVLEHRNVLIPNEGSGKELMEQLFTITEEGNKYCFQDTSLGNPFLENIFDDEIHITKEVIQLPDTRFSGEFLDSVLITKADHSSFRKMMLFGNFQNGKLHDITRVQLLFALTVDGMDLGDIASVNVDPKALNAVPSFIQKANDAIVEENLTIRTRHEFEKFKNIGNMDGIGEPVTD